MSAEHFTFETDRIIRITKSHYQLAKHFNTLWCPEYAREYLLKNGAKYSYDDLLNIAKGQVRLEDEYLEKVRKSERPEYGKTLSDKGNISFGTPDTKPSGLLVIDTDMYVMKIWCEFVFGKCHQFILDQILKRKYDFYLLCDVDLEWTPDELREYPDLEMRKTLFQIYKYNQYFR